MKTLIYTKGITLFAFLFVLGIKGLKAQSNSIVVIDSRYSTKQEVLENLPVGVPLVELNNTENPWKKVRQYLEKNGTVSTIHLFANANYNSLEIGGIAYDSAKVDEELELSMLEGVYQGTNIQLLIYDCNLGSNTEGLALLKKIGDKAYFNIAVPTNCSSIFGADLEFDHTTMDQPISHSIFN
ncbi:DUF4347 domain-containing protein [Pareuzebyella sediminis]|uniref:DUF4347 domain-containing protein n=1 Tax=Pareuzebyella sediminis TaxID=2607998 RepID=UPI0011EBA19B|nr:DUF4347 domain-containing protein [Pareuzebyella sediminis]